MEDDNKNTITGLLLLTISVVVIALMWFFVAAHNQLSRYYKEKDYFKSSCVKTGGKPAIFFEYSDENAEGFICVTPDHHPSPNTTFGQ